MDGRKLLYQNDLAMIFLNSLAPKPMGKLLETWAILPRIRASITPRGGNLLRTFAPCVCAAPTDKLLYQTLPTPGKNPETWKSRWSVGEPQNNGNGWPSSRRL